MIKPININILIEIIEEEIITRQGLIIKENKNDEIKIGIIIKVSESIKNNLFKEKTKIIFNTNDADKLFYHNKNYILLKIDKVLGIIEGE
jgi:co-chaperonin GroES (HSP10)